MAKVFTPKIVTANDLLAGDVIYQTDTDNWTRWHHEAHLYEDAVSAEEGLARAHRQTDRLVGAYLADARIGANGKPEPVHFREAFRTRGPSNYTDHGKQSDVQNV
ncbi:MAG: DUF2849 domain-containing protein [Pseudomonadota bacterium]